MKGIVSLKGVGWEWDVQILKEYPQLQEATKAVNPYAMQAFYTEYDKLIKKRVYVDMQVLPMPVHCSPLYELLRYNGNNPRVPRITTSMEVLCSLVGIAYAYGQVFFPDAPHWCASRRQLEQDLQRIESSFWSHPGMGPEGGIENPDQLLEWRTMVEQHTLATIHAYERCLYQGLIVPLTQAPMQHPPVEWFLSPTQESPQQLYQIMLDRQLTSKVKQLGEVRVEYFGDQKIPPPAAPAGDTYLNLEATRALYTEWKRAMEREIKNREEQK